MDQNFGIKELYEACFKTTLPMRVGDKVFETGEPILYFTNINLAQISAEVNLKIASGGKDGYPLIVWENDKPVTFRMEEGLLSQMSFSLLTGSQMLTTIQPVIIPKNEILETDNVGKVVLFATPRSNSPKFFYSINGENRIKITDYTLVENVLTTSLPYTKIFASYYFRETSGEIFYELGHKKINTIFSFEAKMYYKDKEDGIQKTCVIDLPRVKIQSGLNMTVGEKVSPIVSTFNMISVPEEGSKGQMKFYYLNRDIDYDI